MGEERNARLAQFHRRRQPLKRPEARPVERLLEIDFGAGALKGGKAARVKLGDDPVAIPSCRKAFRPHISVEPVVGMLEAFGRLRDPYRIGIPQQALR